MDLHRLLTVVTLLGTGAALMACQPADQTDGRPGPVEITARDFEFDMPEAIPSGWNTFRFVNESNEQEHFILFGRIPERQDVRRVPLRGVRHLYRCVRPVQRGPAHP